jgi:hypothetical protein
MAELFVKTSNMPRRLLPQQQRQPTLSQYVQRFVLLQIIWRAGNR